MTGDERDRRDSRALEPELITDPKAKAAAEARNGFRQYDAAIGAIQSALDRGSFKLRPSLILGLQREALAGISSYAGNYRPGGVAIEGSKHEPVGAHLVPEFVEDMCDYVNDHLGTQYADSPRGLFDVAAELDSSVCRRERTDVAHRSYVVLSIRAGSILPGTPTIPDQIVDNRKPYFDALDAADLAFRDGRIDVSQMEELLGSLLANQLAQFYRSVGGKLPS